MKNENEPRPTMDLENETSVKLEPFILPSGPNGEKIYQHKDELYFSDPGDESLTLSDIKEREPDGKVVGSGRFVRVLNNEGDPLDIEGVCECGGIMETANASYTCQEGCDAGLETECSFCGNEVCREGHGDGEGLSPKELVNKFNKEVESLKRRVDEKLAELRIVIDLKPKDRTHNNINNLLRAPEDGIIPLINELEINEEALEIASAGSN